MSLVKQTLVNHDSKKHEVAPRRLDLFDRLFDDLPEMFRRPVLYWPDRALDPIRVEEFTEEGTLVIKVELAGIDPEKNVEISVENDVLHISAERQEEEKAEGRDYVRREMRYGAFHRDLALPKGTSDADVKASYKDGILEIRVPLPTSEIGAPKKIPVVKG